jgi:hypothetical protein
MYVCHVEVERDSHMFLCLHLHMFKGCIGCGARPVSEKQETKQVQNHGASNHVQVQPGEGKPHKRVYLPSQLSLFSIPLVMKTNHAGINNSLIYIFSSCLFVPSAPSLPLYTRLGPCSLVWAMPSAPKGKLDPPSMKKRSHKRESRYVKYKRK